MNTQVASFEQIERLLEQHRYDEAGLAFTRLLAEDELEHEEALVAYLGVIAAYFDAVAAARAEYRDALAVSVGLLKDIARLKNEMNDAVDLARVGHEIKAIHGHIND